MRKRNVYLKKSIGFLGCFCVFFLIGCSSKTPTPPPAAPPEPVHIKTLLVLPFQDMARIYGEDVTIQCRLCGDVFTTGKVEPDAVDWMTEQVTTLLKERKTLEIAPDSLAEGARSAVLSAEKGEISERELLVKIGSSVGTDAVLLGKVYRFRDRDGNAFSVASPASVAFEIDLVRVSDGRVVWNGHFDETQQSLFENLFQWNTFWERQARWITAKELSLEGLNTLISAFPVK